MTIERIEGSVVVTWGPRVGSDFTFGDIRLSSDGRWLATSRRAEVILWDVSARRIAHKLAGHTGTVHRFSFSGDGRFLASASYDGTVRVWEIATGHEIRVFNFPSYRETQQLVGRADLNADGSLVLVEYGSVPSRVTIWQVATGNQLLCKSFLNSPNRASFFISSETRSISGHSTEQICEGLSKPVLPGQVTKPYDKFAFSHDYRRLAVTNDQAGEVYLWNLETGVEETRICCGVKAEYGVDKYNPVQSLTFSPDGRRLASTDWRGNVMLWDLASRQAVLVAVERYIATVAFSPDGSQLLFASSGGPLRALDLTSRQELSSWGTQIISINFWVTLGFTLIIVFLYASLCHYKIAVKLRAPRPWRAWVPVWNLFLVIEMANKPAWWIILLLIPGVDIVAGLILWSRICIALGKSPWLVLTFLIPMLGLFVLGYLALSTRATWPDEQYARP
ncbi:MAG TPA: DUF5684 domain-containing protein [Pyrinomonadaceae bacterium]